MNLFSGLGASENAELKLRARNAVNALRNMHGQIVRDAKAIAKIHSSEMRYKTALARIDAKLLKLTNAMLIAQILADRPATEKLARKIRQWNTRKQVNEQNVNLVRRRINTARQAWSKLDKDVKAGFAALSDMLIGARSSWAEGARDIGLRLLQSVARQRAMIAEKMTASALLYDGHDLSPAMAKLRRMPLASA